MKLKSQPRALLATILISNNFINIAIVVLSAFALGHIIPVENCEQWADKYLLPISWLDVGKEKMGNTIHFLITVVGVTFLLVLFGEVTPKVYAKINNVRLARFMAKPLLFLISFFKPFSRILIGWTNVIEKKMPNTMSGKNGSDRSEIHRAIELTVLGEEGEGGEEEIDILKSIIKFGEVAAKQIMRPRVDVVAVDFRISFEELLKTIKDSGFSRIPVYDNDFDNITGILYVKDLLGHLGGNGSFEWQELIRPDVLYVPEAKKINELMKEFQERRLHMGIVVDEYGGCSGIVTLEDILEEVIGDIKDEFDQETEVDFRKIDDHNYVFEGKTLLNDACRVVGLDTNTFDGIKGDADSVAGLVLEVTGIIPKKGTLFEYNNYKFKVLSVNKRRVEEIQITLPKRALKIRTS